MTQGWRNAQASDIDEIAALAARILGAYPEEAAVFAERIRLAPAGCLILERSAKIAGYAISHPWKRRAPPHLNSLLSAIPHDADCWYLHDISILPEVRGSGAGREILSLLEIQAQKTGFSVMAMVAVNNAGPYWARRGFLDRGGPALQKTLKSYDSSALYMEKDLR